MQTLIMLTSISTVLVFVQAGCISGRSTSAPMEKASNVTQNQTNSHISQDVPTRVTKIVAEILSLKPEEVDVNIPLTMQKNAADELDVVEIVLSVEEAYNIEIRDEELGGTLEDVTRELTVRRLVDIVLKKRPADK